jgi:hypothetical protein
MEITDRKIKYCEPNGSRHTLNLIPRIYWHVI